MVLTLASGLAVRGCRGYATPHLDAGSAFECTVEGRVRDGFAALLEAARLVAIRIYGLAEPVVERAGRERMARAYYVLYKLVARAGTARLELRMPVIAETGQPLVVAGVVYGWRPPSPGWSSSFGDNMGFTPGRPVDRWLQAYAARPAIYVSEGSPPPSHPGSVVVEALGSRRLYSLDQLREMAEEIVFDLHCVTGWSVKATRWLAVPLSRLLGPTPRGCWVLVETATAYKTVIHCSSLENAYLALEAEGKPLPRERGGPVRLVAPGLYGWKHAKWVTRVALLQAYVDGYWEARGYHERGLVELEERFKIRNPELAG